MRMGWYVLKSQGVVCWGGNPAGSGTTTGNSCSGLIGPFSSCAARSALGSFRDATTSNDNAVPITITLPNAYHAGRIDIDFPA